MGSISNVKPTILISAISIFGHVEKLILIARELVKRQYDVTFLTAPGFVKAVSSSGANVIPFEGPHGSPTFDQFSAANKIEYDAIPPGLDRIEYEHKAFFIANIPDYYDGMQKAMASIRQSNPSVPIIVIHDCMFLGLLPTRLGASGIRPNGIISVGIMPVVFPSRDTMPFGAAVPCDSSPEGRVRNEAANAGFASIPQIRSMQDYLDQTLKSCGAQRDSSFYFDVVYSSPDRFLQMCIPEIEYPRSDTPKGFSYIGAIPGVGLGDAELPPWWDLVVKHEKPLVVVSSGSLSNNPEDLLLPTIRGLKDMDILVITTLVNIANLSGEELPSNVRVAKFIPFDKLFAHTDVVVNNGGYGTVQQALGHGVPLVLAGLTEDKPETNARTAWSGAAINLATQTPTPVQLRAAVEEILTDKKYTVRAKELAERYAEFDPMGSIVQAIHELAEGE